MIMINQNVQDPHVLQKCAAKNELGKKNDYLNFVCIRLKFRYYKNLCTFMNINIINYFANFVLRLVLLTIEIPNAFMFSYLSLKEIKKNTEIC